MKKPIDTARNIHIKRPSTFDLLSDEKQKEIKESLKNKAKENSDSK